MNLTLLQIYDNHTEEGARKKLNLVTLENSVLTRYGKIWLDKDKKNCHSVLLYSGW